MGNCIVANNQKKPTRNAINRQYTLTVAAQPLQSKNSEEENLPIIKKTNIESKDIRNQKKEHFNIQNNKEQAVELDPLKQINRTQTHQKPNIRPTVSIFVPQQVPITYENRQSLNSPVRQSDIKALFPNGIEESQDIKKNGSKRQTNRQQSRVNIVTQNRNSFEEAVNINDFMASNVQNGSNAVRKDEGIPENLPSTSIRKNYHQEKEVKKFEPKPLSIIQSQDEMLCSQTVSIMGQKAVLNESISKQTRRRPTIEDLNGQSYHQYRRGTC